MSENFNKLKEYICASEKEMVALETVLTAHPALAPENGGQGEAEKAAALVAWLKEQGFKQIKQFDAPDSRVSGGTRPNIVVTIPGKADDYALWFLAHLDVVPTGKRDAWKTDPWKAVVSDGKIYGRGVEDNQQGLVSAVFAANAFLKNGIVPAHTVKLMFMADEEVGSEYGIKYMLKNHRDLFRRNDIILIPDGGDPKGETIEIAEKNILWLRITVKGQQAHGSRPDLGKNASLASADLALRLHALETHFEKHDKLFTPDYSTFAPTMHLQNVEGVNIIPGEDIFCMDCRILPSYTLAEVEKEVRNCCDAVEKKYGVTITYMMPQKEESPATSSDAPVVRLLSSALQETRGSTPKLIGIGGGTVAADFRKLGYAAAVWSTLNDCAHQVNEYAVIKNISDDALVMAVMMDQQ